MPGELYQSAITSISPYRYVYMQFLFLSTGLFFKESEFCMNSDYSYFILSVIVNIFGTDGDTKCCCSG